MDPVRNSQTATTGPSFEPPKARTAEEEKIEKIGQELVFGREPPVARKELTNVKIQEKNQTTVHLERFAAIGSDKEKFELWKQECADLLEGRSDITAVSQLIKTLIKTSIEDGTSSLSEKEKRLLYRKVAETLNACTQTNSYEAQCDSFWVEEQLFTEPNPLTESEGTQIYTGLFDEAIPLALIDLTYTESECRRLCEVLEKIPQEERKVAVQYMKDFFHEELSVSEKVSFLQTVHKMPCQEREDFANACLSLFTTHMNLLEKWDLLLVIFDFPPLQRKNAVEALSHIFTPEMSADEKILHLWIAPTVSQREREELVQIALSLFTSSMSIQKKRKMLEALTLLPPSQRRQAVDAMPHLVMSVDEGILHLWVPPETAQKEREELVQATRSLFTPTMSMAEKQQWLSAVLQLLPLKRKEMVDAARYHLSPEMSMDENMLRLWIPSSIPSRERDELIAITRSLFTTTMSIEEKSEWLSAVMVIPSDKRRKATEEARPLFTPEMSMNEKILHLWAIQYVPPDEREDFVKVALTLLADGSISKNWEKYFLCMSVVQLPYLQRQEFVDGACRFFAPGMCVEVKALHLLIEPYAMPEEDRLYSVQAALPFVLSCKFLVTDLVCLLKIICSMSPLERMDVINHAKTLFTNETTLKDKSLLLDAIRKLPFSERADIINHAKTLFTDGVSWNHKTSLLSAISSICQPERADVINHAKTLFTDGVSLDDKIEFLAAIFSIPYFERVDVIKHAKTLFSDVTPEQGKAAILVTIKSIPKSERAEVINHAKALVTGNVNGFVITALLQEIRSIPKPERVEIINQVCALSVNEKMFRIFLLQAIKPIPRSERMEVINAARPLFTANDAGNSIITFVHMIPPSQREEIVTALEFLSHEQRSSIYSLVINREVIHHIPKERLGGFIKKLILNTQQIGQFPIWAINSESLLLFYLLPNELQSAEILSQEVEDSLENAEYQRAVLTAFENELSSNSSGTSMLIALAQFVFDNSVALRLHDEHQVIQHALELLTAKDVEGEKNPFTLYEKLKKLAKEPSPFQPPSYPVAGIQTAFCMQSLQKNARAFHISRNELPRIATEETWVHLINAFKDNIVSNREAQTQLQETYNTSLDELLDGCLSDSYFVSLLRSTGPTVSIVEAQFRAILHNILAKETHIKEGSIFSEQDEVLIKTAMSIQNCTAGKKEGIAQTYRLLEEGFRYPAKGFETGDKKKDAASAFIAEQIQNIIGNQFSGTNALMQELTGMTEVAEASHHAIYLKNSIGQVVGLHHDVVFDRHTRVLSDSLVAKSREELLEIFFRHLTPQTLVSALVTMANNKNNAHVFKGHLRAFIEDPAEIEQWELTDDGTMNITDRAMMRILKKTGYIS